jgi:hypothetical protein
MMKRLDRNKGNKNFIPSLAINGSKDKKFSRIGTSVIKFYKDVLKRRQIRDYPIVKFEEWKKSLILMKKSQSFK